MSRRDVLAAGAALTATSLAGCAGLVQPESDVEWEGDYYVSESIGDTDAAFYLLGEITNVGGNHIKTLDLTITILDENDQEITSRTKELTGLRVGTTQEFHFRVGLSMGEAGDFGDVTVTPEITSTSYAPLADGGESDSSE